ncbi:MAG: AbrB family transcriptional regulator [Dehalococcoidia bacterium]|nr:AbrB family transcriptional regulator [Dehalococcoidia bacterium]
MAQTDKSECCSPTGGKASCCKVEALISIDERGQMVLPKETRDKANIQAGDKLAVISWEKDGKTCCLTLIKAEELTDMVRNLLGPLMQDIIRE